VIRTALVVLLLGTSCTVPSLEELHCDGSDPLDADDVAGGKADAVLQASSGGCTGVKVTVAYDGFKPGCVRVLARSGNSGREISTDVTGNALKGGPTGGQIIVAAVLPGDWDSTRVEAQAFERTCTGNPVVTNTQQLSTTRGQTMATSVQLSAKDDDLDGYVSTLSGGTDCNDQRPSVHPDAEELCNDLDDNCNGQSDTVELRLGQACTEGPSCEGTRACGSDMKVVCNVPNAIQAYPDVDRDGDGDKNASAQSFCGNVPTGFVTGPPG
jgi:Putative metal-binding motif